MTKLRLTLDKQATSIDDIKPRADTEGLTDALVELAKELEKQLHDAVKKDPKLKAVKYELNNLPSDIKVKSVSTKIYQLRHINRLPLNVLPSIRTVKNEETGEKSERIYLKYYREPQKQKKED